MPLPTLLGLSENSAKKNRHNHLKTILSPSPQKCLQLRWMAQTPIQPQSPKFMILMPSFLPLYLIHSSPIPKCFSNIPLGSNSIRYNLTSLPSVLHNAQISNPSSLALFSSLSLEEGKCSPCCIYRILQFFQWFTGSMYRLPHLEHPFPAHLINYLLLLHIFLFLGKAFYPWIIPHSNCTDPNSSFHIYYRSNFAITYDCFILSTIRAGIHCCLAHCLEHSTQQILSEWILHPPWLASTVRQNLVLTRP